MPRRYASSNGLTGAVVQIPNSSVESYVYEEEDGDIRSKEVSFADMPGSVNLVTCFCFCYFVTCFPFGNLETCFCFGNLVFFCFGTLVTCFCFGNLVTCICFCFV